MIKEGSKRRGLKMYNLQFGKNVTPLTTRNLNTCNRTVDFFKKPLDIICQYKTNIKRTMNGCMTSLNNDFKNTTSQGRYKLINKSSLVNLRNKCDNIIVTKPKGEDFEYNAPIIESLNYLDLNAKPSCGNIKEIYKNKLKFYKEKVCQIEKEKKTQEKENSELRMVNDKNETADFSSWTTNSNCCIAATR